MRSSTLVAAAVALTGLVALAFIAVSCPSRADDESATIGQLDVTQIAATPALRGGTTVVTFSVANTGSEPVTITGVSVPGNPPSRVLGFFGTSHSGAIGALPVRLNETVTLSPKTAWIEVGPLTEDLVVGSVIEGKLLLGRFQAPISIHISSPSSPRGDATRPGRPFPHVGAWLHGAVC